MTTPIDIDRQLTQLAAAVQWPQPRDVSAGVRAAVEAIDAAKSPVEQRAAWQEQTRGRGRARLPGWAGGRRPAVVIALLVVALTAGVLVVSPRTREAVASLLGVAGIEVRVADEVPAAVAGAFRLGEAVPLPEARRRVDFPVKVLDLHGDLDRTGGGVFVDDRIPGGIVHILYARQPGLPEVMPKGVGALLTQFRAPSSGAVFTKQALRSSGEITATEVGGEFALWISGPSHVLIPNREGVPVREHARLSGDALLWSTPDGLTYRLETALAMDAAIALAQTLH